MAKAEGESRSADARGVERPTQQIAQPNLHVHARYLEKELDVSVLHADLDVLYVHEPGPKGPGAPEVDLDRVGRLERLLHTAKSERDIGRDYIKPEQPYDDHQDDA